MVAEGRFEANRIIAVGLHRRQSLFTPSTIGVLNRRVLWTIAVAFLASE
jgi:hypothetical protein